MSSPKSTERRTLLGGLLAVGVAVPLARASSADAEEEPGPAPSAATGGGPARSEFGVGIRSPWQVRTAGTGTVVFSAPGLVRSTTPTDSDHAGIVREYSPSAAMTVEGWWRVRARGDEPGSNVPFARFFQGDQRLADVFRRNDNGQLWLRTTRSVGGRNYIYTSLSTTLAVGTWAHVVFGWNVNGRPAVSVNGRVVLDGSTPIADIWPASAIDTVWIGSHEKGNSGVWEMAEVYVY